MDSSASGIANLCVFCGSGLGRDAAYQLETRKLGELLAGNNIRLIYGGGDMGLMGLLAETVMKHGGQVTGIIPDFLLPYQNGHLELTEQIVTSDMHQRKSQMYKRADGFLALPGGIGTLEELVETLTWSQLRQHKKPIVLLDVNEFWQPFTHLIDHMRADGFIREGLELNYRLAPTAGEALEAITQQIQERNQETTASIACSAPSRTSL